MSEPTVADPMIEVSGVRKAFGETQALDGVDLQVPPATVLGLLGPNGAGKTTLVKVLATLLRPDAGWAKVDGLDVVRQPVAVRSVIGLAGQYAAVDEVLTGRENLEMVGRLYRLSPKDAKVRAEEALERLNLADAADRSVRTYSGGMRRRLDLGASLVGRPRVLILDEPTTGLDPRTRMELWEFIQQLVRDGTTVLLTTQYLEEADALAESIVVIDHGTVIARGTSDELKSQLGGDVLEVGIHRAEDMPTRPDRARPPGRGGLPRRRRRSAPRHPHLGRGVGPGRRGPGPGRRRRRDRRPLLAAALAGRRLPGPDRSQEHRGRGGRGGRQRGSSGRSPHPREEQRMSTRTAPVSPPAAVSHRRPCREARRDRRADDRPAKPRCASCGRRSWSSSRPSSRSCSCCCSTTCSAAPSCPAAATSTSTTCSPGSWCRPCAFGATSTAIGLATDMGTGIIDRFRSLPMARSAVLVRAHDVPTQSATSSWCS